MNRTHQFAMLFFGLVGLLELGDFWGNFMTLFDATTRQQSMDILGISETAQYARLIFLIPVTLGIALSALAMAGQLIRRRSISPYLSHSNTLLLALYAGFIFITAMIAAQMTAAFIMIGFIYAILAGCSFYLNTKLHTRN